MEFTMDDGGSSAASAVVTGPLSERLVHKQWKARFDAYDELAKIFYLAEDESADCYSEYCTPKKKKKITKSKSFSKKKKKSLFLRLLFAASYLKKILQDSNASSLEKGLDVIFNFADRSKIAPKFDNPAHQSDKKKKKKKYFISSFNSLPPSPIRFASELVPLVIEKGLTARTKTKLRSVEILFMFIEIDTPNVVLEELIKTFSHKTPKLRAAAISVAKDVLQ